MSVTIHMQCEICDEAGLISPDDDDDLVLGRTDLSILGRPIIAHRGCWNRDPEAQAWSPLTYGALPMGEPHPNTKGAA